MCIVDTGKQLPVMTNENMHCKFVNFKSRFKNNPSLVNENTQIFYSQKKPA
jgi:hypothetical protein